MSCLWPKCKSPEKLEVRYIPNGFDRIELKEAQNLAKSGRWNLANYLLTSAYRGGEVNEKFWDQFI